VDLIIRALRARDGNGTWLVGGVHLVLLFLAERLINEIIVSIPLILLGSGIPLFMPQAHEIHRGLVSSEGFPSSFVQLKYRFKNPA